MLMKMFVELAIRFLSKEKKKNGFICKEIRSYSLSNSAQRLVKRGVGFSAIMSEYV